ncbi:MAG: undecaprenyldiphospho-muramoylpentapeptide beta-N-acetylglucosaminyltransferase [Bacteroidota bacterium]|jgi:UDP-N-acetylglucosamine--N-acetylmuramyl-(pentapeptide) pyrophosphoryl-undecaprenol N-acetylglucosamine transferase|nr:undecaprenyldiphospho-muramoylpentapeptide beta-N-acetylglucosaminyltransferase [Bacteroidota bacterium]
MNARQTHDGPLRVIFAGGGTGGHLFPGIAIAEALRELHPGCEISFVGSRGRIESRVVPKYGYPFDAVWIAGLQRAFSLRTLLLPLKLLVSLGQSWRILRRRRPHVVVGTGGYVSGPLLYVAARSGRRALIHEQNEYPGITTRKLAPLVDEVHITFPSSARLLPAAKRLVESGNPVRPSLRRRDTGDARVFFGLHPARTTLFVFGGSLGARSINRALRPLVPRLVREEFQLIWQTGTADFTELQSLGALYREQVVVRPFIDEMDLAYSAADLVLCRAGATSLAELTALGIPSLLVPYPHAAADHQYRNAVALAEQGAAQVLRDEELGRLERELFGLLDSRAALARMAEAATAAGRPRAAYDIATAVLRLAGHASRQPNGMEVTR